MKEHGLFFVRDSIRQLSMNMARTYLTPADPWREQKVLEYVKIQDSKELGIYLLTLL